METLQEKLARRAPTVGAAIGSGMTAQAAERGGADYVMVLNAGHFRMQGCSSMAALMPYANANELTWRLAREHVLPRLDHVPAFLGVCAQAPDLNPSELFEQLKRCGMAGVTNFPSVGFIDGAYRQALEETGLGYYREVALLAEARRNGLQAIAFCFDAAQALAMNEAGADLLLFDLGFAEWRTKTEEAHQEDMDGAIRQVSSMIQAVKAVNSNPYVAVLGGPVGTPRDYAMLHQHADVQGYVGGSAIERFPAAPLITQTVEEFKRAPDVRLEGGRFGAMTGKHASMTRVYETIQRVADTDVPVLIVGESGVGKELAARELYRRSGRRARPLVCWNCGALTETLAMSELFGHEKGAFTGATHRHHGKFEHADGATLFMDEITELPLPVQASLLRVIQEREIVRVGGQDAIPVDVRLIASTNRDLGQLVRQGRFRLDLYYRLSTVVLHLPPLRERRSDIPTLVSELAHEFARKYDCPVPRISDDALDVLIAHEWPGNIRELRNAVERCVILGRGEPIRVEWFEDMFRMQAALTEAVHPPVQSRARGQARRRLFEVLDRHEGNKAAAARELGVTRKTIYSWLRQDGETP